MTSTKPAVAVLPASVYRLKVTLATIRPPIWRRILVPSDVTLARLHQILQTVMGWQDYHLHQFAIGEAVYGDQTLIEDWHVDNERTARLAQVAPHPKDRLRYEYDFGDSWEHDILVEAVLPPDPGMRSPVCVAGKRACPPEDCGGAWGYADLLAALSDSEHPMHAELLEWSGGSFDPEAFDVNALNRRLAAFR